MYAFQNRQDLFDISDTSFLNKLFEFSDVSKMGRVGWGQWKFILIPNETTFDFKRNIRDKRVCRY